MSAQLLGVLHDWELALWGASDLVWLGASNPADDPASPNVAVALTGRTLYTAQGAVFDGDRTVRVESLALSLTLGGTSVGTLARAVKVFTRRALEARQQLVRRPTRLTRSQPFVRQAPDGFGAGMPLSLAMGSITISATQGATAATVQVTGRALGVAVGAALVSGLAIPRTVTLSSLAATLTLGTVTPRILAVVTLTGVAATLTRGAITVSTTRSVAVAASGRAITTVQGTGIGSAPTELRLHGTATVTVAPRTRVKTATTLGGTASLTLTARKSHTASATMQGSTHTLVRATQRYRGHALIKGSVSVRIDLRVVPPSVASLMQQFDAEQQLGVQGHTPQG